MRVRACASVVLVAAIAACGGGDARPRGAPVATATPAGDALVGIVTPWSGNGGTVVAPLDPQSLKPGRPRAVLGEYHDAWSVSPDGSRIAVGISAPGERGRIGVRVLDRETLQTVSDSETGIAAEAVGWLSRERVGALLQSGDAVVVDADDGAVVSRAAVPIDGQCLFGPPTAVTPLGLVVIAEGRDGSARLILITEQGPRVVRLGRLTTGERAGTCERAGLAVDPATLRAYVVARGAPIAEVNLRTLRVRERPAAQTVPRCGECAVRWDALALGRGRLVVASREATTRTETPGGVALVDTRRGTARTIRAGAGGATLAGDRLLVYDGGRPLIARGRRAGLWTYGRDGRGGAPLVRGDRIWDVQVAGDRAYARGLHRLHVIDLRRERVIARSPALRSEIVVLPRRPR